MTIGRLEAAKKASAENNKLAGMTSIHANDRQPSTRFHLVLHLRGSLLRPFANRPRPNSAKQVYNFIFDTRTCAMTKLAASQ